MKPNSSPLFAAVDGGQTRSLGLLADSSGRILATADAGPSNHLNEPGGPERLRSALHNSLFGALATAQRPPEDISQICLGMTGSPAPALDLVRQWFPGAEVTLVNDAVTALAGAGLGHPGVVVIAGTGAIAYGEISPAHTAWSDGWGYLIGDEGSAYSLGVAALRAAVRALDGRGPQTVLVQKILEHWRLADWKAVHQSLYSGALSRPEIASLAKVIHSAALEEDTVSILLLEAAGDWLGKSAVAVLQQLDALESRLPVFTAGGVFRAGKRVTDAMQRVLERSGSNASVEPAKFAPIIGGLVLALRKAGISIEGKVLEQLEDSGSTLKPK
jgi:N-acetylglucosamine kinase-like BadF-type ATPase